MNWHYILDIIDTILFTYMAFSVGYLLIYTLFAQRRQKEKYSETKRKYRFVVLFPAYKEDAIIETAVKDFLKQEYPKELYDIVVISDKMQDETNLKLSQLPINLLNVNFENSSKAKALNFAVSQLKDATYDVVIILDADNTVCPNFLHLINNAYHSGCQALQAHRIAKNRNTDTAILDAVSEEINNSIFRKGHVNLGVSSALIGSGMAFEYSWFKNNIQKVSSVGEDKEFEILLLKQGIFIDYLEYVDVYDEKTQKESALYNQRRRWMAAQLSTLKVVFRDLPKAIFTGNIDYCDKLIQWLLLPRIILVGLIAIISAILICIDWTISIKWILILFLLLFTLCAAIPDYLVNDSLKRALKRIPVLFIMLFLNLFKLRGASKKFIHTEHSHNE